MCNLLTVVVYCVHYMNALPENSSHSAVQFVDFLLDNGLSAAYILPTVVRVLAAW